MVASENRSSSDISTHKKKERKKINLWAARPRAPAGERNTEKRDRRPSRPRHSGWGPRAWRAPAGNRKPRGKETDGGVF